MSSFYQTSVIIPDVPLNVKAEVGDIWTFPDLPLLRFFKISTTTKSYTFKVTTSGISLLICVQKTQGQGGTAVDLLGTSVGDYDLGSYLRAFQRSRWRSDLVASGNDAETVSLMQADANDLYVRYVTSTRARLYNAETITMPYVKQRDESFDAFYLKLFFLDSGRPVFESDGSQNPLLFRDNQVTFAAWAPIESQRYDFSLRALSWVGSRGGRVPAVQDRLIVGPPYEWEPRDARDWSIVASLAMLGVRDNLLTMDDVRAKLALYAPNLTTLQRAKQSDTGSFPHVPWFVNFRDNATAISSRDSVDAAKEEDGFFELGSLKVPLVIAGISIAIFVLVRSGALHALAGKMSGLPLPEGFKKALINFSLSDSWAHRVDKKATILIDGVMRDAKVFVALIARERVLYWGNTPYEVLDYDIEGNAFVVELAALGTVLIQKVSVNREGAIYHARTLTAKTIQLDNYQKERPVYDHAR